MPAFYLPGQADQGVCKTYRGSEALAIVDGVVATAALQEDMGYAYGNNEAYKIDVVLTGSQRRLGFHRG